jgi:hypothetical protein
MDVQKTAAQVKAQVVNGINNFFLYAYIPTLLAIGKLW